MLLISNDVFNVFLCYARVVFIVMVLLNPFYFNRFTSEEGSKCRAWRRANP